ncbi:hypothetical protein [Aeromonas aquatica]|uniref:hypothetical protein n=1 Tax=Aeromonas aquatica TaxID=558964 RepID=UPI00126A07B2|nr:hypothetical protein [Aeromonas aquatica]
MMVALRGMTYFKVSLSTRNWDSALKNGAMGDKNNAHPGQDIPFCHLPNKCNPSFHLDNKYLGAGKTLVSCPRWDYWGSECAYVGAVFSR